ncbi:MAG: S41 family peptidase [Armatimonadota bacterium]
MKRMQSKVVSRLTLVLLMITSFIIGYQVSGSRAGGLRPVWAAIALPQHAGLLDDSVTLRPVQLFTEALNKLQREYVEPLAQPNELAYSAIRGMLRQLKDPYTRFMDPKEFKDFNEDNAGHFAGIGATLDMKEIPLVSPKPGKEDEKITCPVCSTEISDLKQFRVSIVEPLDGSPAKAAGLHPGDLILKVDDQSTDGQTLEEVAGKIRGPEGTKVKLNIERKSVDKPFDVTITRAQIEVPAVKSKILPDNIGYLRLYKFNEKTARETALALEEFNATGVRGVVLDLRGNPGGMLQECVKVASMFLPKNEDLIVSTKSRGGQETTYNRLGKQIYQRPMVVLVNKGSASASEILSGAIKDYKRAPIVGESTFGKALVQSVMPMSDGSAMTITTAHYYTPKGYDVGKKGVAPDVVVALAKDAKELNEKDNQAQAALKILHEAIAKAE